MTTQFAKTLGSIAFAKGSACAPAMDADFMAQINPEVGSNVKAMQAWIAGWVGANLAA